MKYFETEKKIIKWFKGLNPIYKTSFWVSFALINLAFLFHTINFMFGDHDWNYVRTANYWSEGSFEGRPLHFLLQSIFFGGHVLPVLNNLLSFASLALSGLLLANYWRVPKTIFNYTIMAVFVAILPFTMVWLFYAKDMLSNLSLPLVVIGGLWLADKEFNAKNIYAHIGALLLFYFAFASYAAVINLFGVVFLGGILIAYINGDKLGDIIKQKLPAVAEIIIALVLYKITLALLSVSSDYNTATITAATLPQKFSETLTVMLTQFTTPIPFMEYKYKILLLVLCLFGVVVAMIKGGVLKAPLSILIILAIVFASKFAFFIADEKGSILAEMENFAFVPRLDFYGLAYIYALGLALTLNYTQKKWYKAGAVLAIVITFMSGVRDMYAEKVWKLGFDAEMKAHERIVSRLEQMPEFRAGQKYRLFQVGSLSLRENFYKEVKGEATSLDLLSTAFTPQFMSRIVYNFYYPDDIFVDNVGIESLSAAGINYLRNAKVWPATGSIFIDGDIVIIVLTEEGLNKVMY